MTYRVFIESQCGRVVGYVVTAQPVGWDSSDKDWPWMAKFRVSVRYDQEQQERRASEYCAYLNKNTQTVLPPIE